MRLCVGFFGIALEKEQGGPPIKVSLELRFGTEGTLLMSVRYFGSRVLTRNILMNLIFISSVQARYLLLKRTTYCY